MFKLEVEAATGKLIFKKVGDPARGSLEEICAGGNVDQVNALGMRELWCAYCASRNVPFPLGDGEVVYKKALEIYDEGVVVLPDLRSDAEKRQLPLWNTDGNSNLETPYALGQMRLFIVDKAGSGINAPMDSYLRIAYDLKVNGKVGYGHNY